MAEKEMPSIVGVNAATEEALGRVQLAPEVLEVIIGIATNEVNGVAYTRGNFATGVAEKLGRAQHGKGVKIGWDKDGLTIDIFCVVQYGFPVRDVARNIQEQVRNAIFNMTSLKTKEINIHITGIEMESETE